jgi:hypothetical protein
VLESAVERHFIAAVRRIGGMTYKIAPVDAGIPDRLVLLPGGRLFLVELKTETGRLRPIQRVWHERAAELGTHVVVLHGTAEVEEWVTEVAE